MHTSMQTAKVHYGNRVKVLLENKIINQYGPQNFDDSNIIGSGGLVSVYAAKWKNTSTVYVC